MASSLFGNLLGSPNSSSPSGTPNNSKGNIFQQFAEFKRWLGGKDPVAMVKQMLADGRMTQQEFDQLAKQARSLEKILR